MKDTLAVIVIYEASPEVSETLCSLDKCEKPGGEKLDVFIYDNSRFPHVVPTFKTLDIVAYRHDQTNPGVGKAYNEGYKLAKTLGKDRLLLLDQDTVFGADTLTMFRKAIELHPDIELFCPLVRLRSGLVCSPFRIVLKRGVPVRDMRPGTYSSKKYAPINSGILVTVGAYGRVGGYNERVRLDFSDMQFMERLSRVVPSIRVTEAEAWQNFSNEVSDKGALLKRFIYYCEGARESERAGWGDDLIYLGTVMLRATKLAWRTRSLSFFGVVANTYLRWS